jgi:CRISPR-associated protein, Cas2 family
MKAWKVGGQKSFCECWLTPAEQRSVLDRLDELIDPKPTASIFFRSTRA